MGNYTEPRLATDNTLSRDTAKASWKFSIFVWIVWFLASVVALLWIFPASVFNGVRLGPVMVKQAAGSIWHGQVELGLSGLLGGDIPGVWAWRFAWDDGVVVLLSGSLMRQEVRVQPKWQDGLQVDLSDGTIDLPAQWLESLGSAFPTVRPRGTLNVSWEKANINVTKRTFALDSSVHRSQGWASVLWRDASLAISRYNPLGTYRLTLTPRGENLTFELSLITENGVLNATGHGVVGVSSAQFNARLSADREHVAMNRLLELIGQKRVDGDQVFVEL